MGNNAINEAMANAEIQEEIMESFGPDMDEELEDSKLTGEDEAVAEAPSEDENEAEETDGEDSDPEDEDVEAPSGKKSKKKERNRSLTDSEIAKNAEDLAKWILDDDFKATELLVSKVCDRYGCAKPMTEKTYIEAMPKLIAGGKVLALKDDEPAANSNTPFINDKGTVVISKAALENLPSFTTWKKDKTKFVVAEKDGIITMTPIQ